MAEKSNATPYDIIGGENAVGELVERFYHYMDTLPEAQTIRRMHQPDPSAACRKLRKFLSGWLGGPDLYVREHGHPRLRMRHLPFDIGSGERDQWLLCMRQALDDMSMTPEFRKNLYQALSHLATHMINRAG